MGVLETAVSGNLDSLANYKFVKCIESGTFGSVALYEDTDGVEVLVKVVKRSALNLAKEDAIVKHSTLSSPYVVSMVEVVVRRDGVVRIVMEYCNGGTLESYVQHSKDGRLTEEEARGMFQQLIHAVEYTQRMSVTDRDLKLSNTLLHRKVDGGLQLKVSDFGYGIHDTTDMQRRAQALAYVAPEVMDHEDYEDELSDMWQCGVMLYAMLYGRLPFTCAAHLSTEEMGELHARELAEGIVLPDDVTLSPGCADLLYRLMAPVPADRAHLADVMSHPWIVTDLDEQVQKSLTLAVEEPVLPMKKRQSVQDIKQLLDFATA